MVIRDYIQTIEKLKFLIITISNADIIIKIFDYLQMVNIPNADVTTNTNIIISDLLHQSTSDEHSQVSGYLQIVTILNTYDIKIL